MHTLSIATKSISIRLIAVFLLMLLLLTITIYSYKLDALLLHLWKSQVTHKIIPSTSSLNLDEYQVSIEAKPIAGVDDDVSGLTYNKETDTLFSVLNGKPLVVELDREGNILRTIEVMGVRDMEGITHVEGNRYVVVDEYDQKIILLELEEGLTKIDATQAPQISLGITATGNNKDFEGVSWDERNQRLLVVKERHPLSILEIAGFVENPKANSGLRISQIAPSVFSNLKLRDFSSITYHDPSGHLVILSDESRIAAEYDFKGNAVSALALWRGFHGLEKSVPQAEGIAIGPDNRVYIVSEPNLFYVFSPPH
jgi:uncharacterized protein YjiK